MINPSMIAEVAATIRSTLPTPPELPWEGEFGISIHLESCPGAEDLCCYIVHDAAGTSIVTFDDETKATALCAALNFVREVG